MSYYLVDYENVKRDGLNGINELSAEDTVCIFYSENADTITFDMHRKINESQAKIVFQEVEVGTKNALDFQLATYLGYLVAADKKQEYYIVTKDNGFNILCTYWSKQGITITMVMDLSGRNIKKEQAELAAEVGKLIEDADIAATVTKCILQYKTKQGINNALMKQYPSKDNKQASEIYNAIKPLLVNKKGR
ncbi:MAG: PIN domain-containing protein [Roseburia sp.]|nr:PIN domain-containing protein [Ruminococcus sp.]MCM1154172.1 PIN domain-containing protein [Roseburia sp.]MCM1241298.1 PIN domain-containing protein [Roseburia sp.]